MLLKSNKNDSELINFTPNSKEEAISRVIDHLISRLWAILRIRDVLNTLLLLGCSG